jgi:hypothetical protein
MNSRRSARFSSIQPPRSAVVFSHQSLICPPVSRIWSQASVAVSVSQSTPSSTAWVTSSQRSPNHDEIGLDFSVAALSASCAAAGAAA